MEENVVSTSFTGIVNAVPVPVASEQTANWRNFINGIVGTTATPIYGFFIPQFDLEQVLKFAVGGIRVYTALRKESDPSSIHLYVVPLDGDGNDILTENDRSVIYDTTQPCPPCCGEPNALNS